jgi:putative phosphoesterase
MVNRVNRQKFIKEFDRKNNMLGIIGDFHLGGRGGEVPKEFVAILGGCELIACTGDLTDPWILLELEKITKVKIVKGNMDIVPLPAKETFGYKGLKIGLIHGSEIHPRGDLAQLEWTGKEMGVDVLIHGHTHKMDVRKVNGLVLLNPGSATGARSGAGAKGNPSFLTLETEQKGIYIDSYEVNEVVEKRTYRL